MHAANALVGGTGLVYAWMCYFAVPVDEFAIVNHPWQPALQHAHVLSAPLLVFAGGVIWHRHVWTRVRDKFKQRRTTGLGLALTLVPMIASGYLIQTAGDELWRKLWVAVHLVSSGLWLAGYVAHLLTRPADVAVANTDRGQRIAPT
jgi:undecaprenyl pyrophosphate phosphatase UppP